MISIHLDYFDEETEHAIVAARTGMTLEDTKKIVGILRDVRHMLGSQQEVSIRSAIIIGKVITQERVPADKDNPLFVDICIDTLVSGRLNDSDRSKMTETIISIVHKRC
jgi:hypothetical protein